MEGKELRCDVCMHHCRLKEGQYGRCGARRNIEGDNTCINYGKVTGLALDPIEKKPLAYFYPGSMILSVGSFGCNLNCPFCQNDSIAMAREGEVNTVYVTPKQLAKTAYELKKDGNIGVAFTYNEPLIGYEYVRDTAILVHQYGMKTVVVTNGSIGEKAAEEILPHIDAYNIDLKGFTDTYYDWIGGNLSYVKEFIRKAAACAHVELTTLIVPGRNDDEEQIRKMCEWIASVDKTIPLHLTRFFPRRNLKNEQPTDIGTLFCLKKVAEEYLCRISIGNI